MKRKLLPAAPRILRLLPVLALDALLVAASYAAALALRFDGSVPRVSMVFFGQVVAVIIVAYLIGNYLFGIYRTAWQYASLADAVNLASAVGLVSLLLFGVNAMLNPRHIPLTVTVYAPALIFLSMSLTKLWPRLRSQTPFATWGGPMRHVLIAGAGATGQLLAREFLQHPEWEYKPVGFVDDDKRKRGIRIHGVTVLGGRRDIPRLARDHHVDMVALAMPSADGATIRDYVGACQDAGLSVRTVPGLPEMVHGVTAAQLREITFEDLLGRQEAEVDLASCAAAVRDKTVLITGAAGYLGQELSRQLLELGPAALHLLDTNETGLFDMQRDLLAEGAECDVKIWMTDITDRNQVERALSIARPDLVFHTAAYKHIPVVEQHPEAAFHVNVVGTLNIARAADLAGAEKVVLVSTTKAGELDSVYGATKRIGELVLEALGERSDTICCVVRLHNVMGSRGSVVPLFLRQIERGGPVLLTSADATRHFMSPPEAVRLLLQATAFARQGQLFMLDLGEEVKIADLAEKLIRLRGFQPGRDIEIVYTGLRPGEQLSEEPLERRGLLERTAHPRIYLTTQGRPPSFEELTAKIDELRADVPADTKELAAHLHALARIDLRDVVPAHLTDS
jgi:FlaA1/EpsC-like NDP-sugar epimerase